MTSKEAIEYNKNLREYMSITDKDSEYKFLQENYEALDMAIKALEIVNDFERANIITGGRLNGRAYAYKCGFGYFPNYYYFKNHECILNPFSEQYVFKICPDCGNYNGEVQDNDRI